ncbi:hypothetical protein [Thiocystis violacea]|uniref:hypothetical protein n=1 Tax=Thiocystis violacea TaxID=13725 RepID=UPI001907117B|nr:hypothetical protein [Thiocystis violacea]
MKQSFIAELTKLQRREQKGGKQSMDSSLEKEWLRFSGCDSRADRMPEWHSVSAFLE